MAWQGASGRYLIDAAGYPSQAFTIMGWIRINGAGSGIYQDIASTANTGGSLGWWFELNNLTLTCYSGASNTGSTLSANTWYHVALTRASGTGQQAMNVYLDGAVDITGFNGIAIHSDRGLYLAEAASYIGSPWLGQLSYFKVWSAALTQAEIQAEMYSAAPVRSANIHAYLPFIAPAGSDLGDDRTGVNDFAITGTGTISDLHPGIPWHGTGLVPMEIGIAAGADVTGTFAATFPIPTMSTSGTVKTTGPFAGTFPIPTMSAAGNAISTINGPFAGTFPVPTMSAAGTDKRVGTFAGTFPVPTMAASGNAISTISGDFAGTMPIPTMSAAGVAKRVGDFAGTFPVPTMSAAGLAKRVGTFGATFPVPTMSASGTVTPSGADVTGDFAATFPVPTMSSSGTVKHVGDFAATFPVPTMAASGLSKHIGTFTATFPVPTMTASGLAITAITGTLDATFSVPTMAASGTVGTGAFGPFAATFPVPLMRAFGIIGTRSPLYDSPRVANTLISGLHLRIQLVQAKSGFMQADEVLLTREIRDFHVNEPILLNYPSRSVNRYMNPLKVRIEVLDGDATVLKDAIMTLRYRRGI